MVLALFLSLEAKFRGFGAVVERGLFEPRVLEGFFRGDAGLGIVEEDLPEEVEEHLVE